MIWQIYPISRFPDFHNVWDELIAKVIPVPFLESGFLQPLLDEFGSGNEILAISGTGANLQAATILCRGRLGIWQTFQPSQLPLGPWVAQPGSDLIALAKSLIKALPGFALGVGITQIDPKLVTRPPATVGANMLDYIETAWVDVEGDFDTYWNARGKNLRTNVRKQRTKLETDGVATTLECIVQPEQIATAMSDYGILENAGWKAEGHTAIHPDNAQGRFYRKMLETFCDKGRGRIYRYRFDEKTVAMDLCILAGDTIVILKTAYDETYKSLSPSTLQRYEQFKQIFEARKLRRIEFYGKILEWHTRWTYNARTLYHANVFRWPVLAQIHQWRTKPKQDQSMVTTSLS